MNFKPFLLLKCAPERTQSQILAISTFTYFDMDSILQFELSSPRLLSRIDDRNDGHPSGSAIKILRGLFEIREIYLENNLAVWN